MDIQALQEENLHLSEENRRLREIVSRVQALVNASAPCTESKLTSQSSQSTATATNQKTEQKMQKSSKLSNSLAKSPILGLSRPPVKRRLNMDPQPPNQLEFEPGANKWEVYLGEPNDKKQPLYDYKEEAVRGKARRALPGHACTACEDYYAAAGLDQKGISKCSKHRSRKPRQKSPKGFWDLDFPSTQELQKRWAALPSPADK